MVSINKYIGSLITTVYNDAKRATLSAWSWPSRRISADMASHYNVNGKVQGWIPNFQYVTPPQHPQFLDCIVKSDLANYVSCFKNSLAVYRYELTVQSTDHSITTSMLWPTSCIKIRRCPQFFLDSKSLKMVNHWHILIQ